MTAAQGVRLASYHNAQASRRKLHDLTSWQLTPEKPRGRRVRWTLALAALCLVALGSFAYSARERIAAAFPAAQRVYATLGIALDPIGLRLEDAHIRIGQIGDKKVLMVEAYIVNPRSIELKAPDLRILLRGDEGREIYAWTTHPPKDRIVPGERARFAARLEAPPEGASEAIVSFVSPSNR